MPFQRQELIPSCPSHSPQNPSKLFLNSTPTHSAFGHGTVQMGTAHKLLRVGQRCHFPWLLFRGRVSVPPSCCGCILPCACRACILCGCCHRFTHSCSSHPHCHQPRPHGSPSPPAEISQVSFWHMPSRFRAGNTFSSPRRAKGRPVRVPQRGRLAAGGALALEHLPEGLCGVGKDRKRQGCGEVRKTKEFRSSSHIK